MLLHLLLIVLIALAINVEGQQSSSSSSSSTGTTRPTAPPATVTSSSSSRTSAPTSSPSFTSSIAASSSSAAAVTSSPIIRTSSSAFLTSSSSISGAPQIFSISGCYERTVNSVLYLIQCTEHSLITIIGTNMTANLDKIWLEFGNQSNGYSYQTPIETITSSSEIVVGLPLVADMHLTQMFRITIKYLGNYSPAISSTNTISFYAPLYPIVTSITGCPVIGLRLYCNYWDTITINGEGFVGDEANQYFVAFGRRQQYTCTIWNRVETQITCGLPPAEFILDWDKVSPLPLVLRTRQYGTLVNSDYGLGGWGIVFQASAISSSTSPPVIISSSSSSSTGVARSTALPSSSAPNMSTGSVSSSFFPSISSSSSDHHVTPNFGPISSTSTFDPSIVSATGNWSGALWVNANGVVTTIDSRTGATYIVDLNTRTPSRALPVVPARIRAVYRGDLGNVMFVEDKANQWVALYGLDQNLQVYSTINVYGFRTFEVAQQARYLAIGTAAEGSKYIDFVDMYDVYTSNPAGYQFLYRLEIADLQVRDFSFHQRSTPFYVMIGLNNTISSYDPATGRFLLNQAVSIPVSPFELQTAIVQTDIIIMLDCDRATVVFNTGPIFTPDANTTHYVMQQFDATQQCSEALVAIGPDLFAVLDGSNRMTYFAPTNGSAPVPPVPVPTEHSSETNELAIGAGIGIGAISFVVLTVVGVILIKRRMKSRSHHGMSYDEYVAMFSTGESIPTRW